MDNVFALFEFCSFSFVAYRQTNDEARGAFNRGVDEHSRSRNVN